MASSDHLASSNFIKSVHQKLRDDSKIVGAEKAWHKHCGNEENLRKYASAMYNLATNHWESNYKRNSKAASRVEWAYQFIQTYFVKEEFLKHRQKERKIAEKINLEIANSSLDLKKEKYRLLDVGSCYNPFKQYKCLEVVPIDIAPATNDVHKCDFLNLNLSSCVCSVNSEISELQIESFDVIVFSLFLEYLPLPSQRLVCCEKAYNLLKAEGLLIVITPDSKHVGANAKIMKSWRFVLSKIGFSRIKYEKLSYLHCMVFRKSLQQEIPQRWALLHKDGFYDELVIPQDFKKVETPSVVTKISSDCDINLFDELPEFGDE